MAIRQRKDGRWVVYYRAKDGTKRTIEEYFGRGAEGEASARRRHRELGLNSYRGKSKVDDGVQFFKLAETYVKKNNFKPNPKSNS